MITTVKQLKTLVDTLIIVSEGKIKLKVESYIRHKDEGYMALYFEKDGNWYMHDDVKTDVVCKYNELKEYPILEDYWL